MEPAHCGFTLADVEREHILDTLMCCHGNRTLAAKLLGISLRSLRIKLHDYVQSGCDVCKPSIGADDPPALCDRAKSPAAPADGIETERPVNSPAPKKIISDSFGGTHHCIVTGHAVVDMVFRYLRASCNSRGGTLTESELATARLELIESFASAFDIFDAVHQTCMDASGATAAMAFSQDKILSSLLRASSERSAVHVFSNEIGRQGSAWLIPKLTNADS